MSAYDPKRTSRVDATSALPAGDNFDPETLAILEAAFNEAWEVLTNSGGTFDQEATRNALADLIMSFASEGETNPKRLKELALAALPRTLTP